MNADDCNRPSYAAGNGGVSSAEQDFYGESQSHPTKSSSSRQSSPHRSLSVNSIKVELCSDEESSGAPQPEIQETIRADSGKVDRAEPMEEGVLEFGGNGRNRGSIYSDITTSNSNSPGPIRLPNGKLQCEVCGMICIGPNVLMVHKRSHTGERPFQCNQCGASFTQKGNLLRHIKLHSGEKPFKCPICNYACRRRDALAGHLRTHAVGKPFKCSYCSRSYKQQSTLGEHLERCHNYLKTLDPQMAVNHQAHQESADTEKVTKPIVEPSGGKIHLVDRLSSMTKRKRSTPQKFLGEKHMHLDPPEAPYELSSSSEKEGDLLSLHSAGDSFGLTGSHFGYGGGKSENVESAPTSHVHLGPAAELPTVVGSISNNHMTPQSPQVHSGAVQAAMSIGLPGRERSEMCDEQALAHSHTTSPNGCPDSTDTESTAEEQSTRATIPISTSNNHHLHYQAPPLPHTRGIPSPNKAKDLDTRWEKGGSALPSGAKRSLVSPLSPGDSLQVFDRAGRPVRSYHCRHCRILFLDHVMFTIHMGCHGFRQPFECNICGHPSQDRYEFSSHISRGEHQVG